MTHAKYKKQFNKMQQYNEHYVTYIQVTHMQYTIIAFIKYMLVNTTSLTIHKITML